MLLQRVCVAALNRFSAVDMLKDILPAVAADPVFFDFADAYDHLVSGAAEAVNKGISFPLFVWIEVGRQAVIPGFVSRIERCDFYQEPGGIKKTGQYLRFHGHLPGEGEIQGDLSVPRLEKPLAIGRHLGKRPLFYRNDPVP